MIPAVDGRQNAISVALVERNARQGGQHFDAHRRQAEPDDRVLSLEQLWGERLDAEAELAQHANHPVGILRRHGDPDVEIGGCARIPVEGDGMPADQKALNARRVEQSQKLFEVGR
jgi:hypothetical protein